MFQADGLAAACSLHVDSVPPTGRSPSSLLIWVIIFFLLLTTSFNVTPFHTSPNIEINCLGSTSDPSWQDSTPRYWFKIQILPLLFRPTIYLLFPPQTKELRSLNVSRAADTSKLVSLQVINYQLLKHCFENQPHALTSTISHLTPRSWSFLSTINCHDIVLGTSTMLSYPWSRSHQQSVLS